MTRDGWEVNVRLPARKKWEEGTQQTIETFVDWWIDKGNSPCSFCANYKNRASSWTCGGCPLHAGILGKCCKEFNIIHEASLAYKKDQISKIEFFSIFLLRAEQMCSRIKELPNPYSEHKVEPLDEFEIPHKKFMVGRLQEGYLNDGAIHTFKEVRLGWPMKGELYNGGGCEKPCRIFRCDEDWVKKYPSCKDDAGDTLIVELVD